MINVPLEQIAPGDAADPWVTPRESSSGTGRAAGAFRPCTACASKTCQAPARLPQGLGTSEAVAGLWPCAASKHRVPNGNVYV